MGATQASDDVINAGEPNDHQQQASRTKLPEDNSSAVPSCEEQLRQARDDIEAGKIQLNDAYDSIEERDQRIFDLERKFADSEATIQDILSTRDASPPEISIIPGQPSASVQQLKWDLDQRSCQLNERDAQLAGYCEQIERQKELIEALENGNTDESVRDMIRACDAQQEANRSQEQEILQLKAEVERLRDDSDFGPDPYISEDELEIGHNSSPVDQREEVRYTEGNQEKESSAKAE